MSAQIGFDNEKYLEQQSGEILSRVARFNHKLYLEFGGKILFDYHAARVLPGFDPNVKMRLLQRLKDDIDVILCIFSGDIERKKLRADFGITYDTDSLKTIDDFKQWGVEITAVVITRYADQPSAKAFKNKLERRGIRVFTHSFTKGYPTDVDLIVSDAGYGSNAYIPTTKPIVIVTGPGPGSGKLATCLGQLYHEYKRGVQAGYAKFETFPIWNLPLNHNVNAAYEAATVDLKDFNLIDPHHLESYGKTAVNYNRDVEAFPLLRKILEKITGTKSFYQSPTDMGVNRAGFGIIDDSIVQKAAHQEIIRRYFRCACEYALGYVEKDILERAEMIMKRVDGSEQARPVIALAREAAVEAMEKGKGNDGIYCGAAVELADGTLLTGKNSSLMHAASSLTLNAIKHLAGLPDNLHLIPENVISALAVLKKNILQGKGISLDVEETLIALTISAISNPAAELATGFLKELRGCEVHLTHIPTPGDEAGLRKLGVHLTSDPEFSSKSLFIN
jgi:uncharacterized protein (UPF0371 family)